MNEIVLPDLSIPNLYTGIRETKADLKPLLYLGGAKTRRNKVSDMIDKGLMGPPKMERLKLLERVSEHFKSLLISGGSKKTIKASITVFRDLVGWADIHKFEISLEQIENTYISWTEYLQHEILTKGKNQSSLYQNVATVAVVIDTVLNRNVPLLLHSKIRTSSSKKYTIGSEADKQNLEETFVLGSVLLDICDALSFETVNGPVPVKIPLRKGGVHIEWAGRPFTLIKNKKGSEPTSILAEVTRQDARTKSLLINLRIEAELLIFIAQTGMNLSQAIKMNIEDYSYSSHLDGYQVRKYKNRRGGEVEFEIYKEYKGIFEKFIAWRKSIFPDDPNGLLFRFFDTERSLDAEPHFRRVASACNRIGIKLIRPRALRKTRINYILRKVQSEDITIEMAQHSRQTLIRHYEKPNFQTALIEIAKFHNKTDPSLAPPGPGICISRNPKPAEHIPIVVAQPDCLTPSGCLFCANHRDLDTQDHVWSLTSFRHLKSLELIRFRPPSKQDLEKNPHPAKLTIERITEKITFFRESSSIRNIWVDEALSRVAEANYHPYWNGFIELLES